ncbi:hypothetical protein [Edaphobacter bradus]|uniref:hypothetical protein n=1 Tax=Edaphobacter bradus TaxID=2259016 RepID=UPI0021DFFDD2|nr:hypothetical protein [Edaphobacter bradus]
MNTEAFAGSRLRIQWAKESLADFERCANVYFKRAPCEVFIEPDPDGIHERYKFRICKPLPLALTKHTIHAVEDLRAALDLAACDVARCIPGISVDGIYFPFCRTSGDLKGRINGVCKGLPTDITDLFARYEPYAGGSDLLFAMNELCKASKHKLLVPVASVVGVNLPHLETSDVISSPIRFMDGVYGGEEDEITFAVTQRGLKWKYKAQFSFGIQFGKVGIIEGRDVRANVDGMIRAVTMIVNETEAESRRLGLLK